MDATERARVVVSSRKRAAAVVAPLPRQQPDVRLAHVSSSVAGCQRVGWEPAS